jgi:uncharacterized protein YyaL (SSP411 family)
VNRLGGATSPYLLQHKDNPVDWWEWSDEAFAEAKRRDVPVLISVGYSACHWCHVMAHESFEDEATGTLINDKFVAIKVDREERPDVDAVYMQATQAMTGQGGWPMTVFATPDGQPFYCGTYYPKQHFQTLLEAIDEAWRTQRETIVEQGAEVVKAIAGQPLQGDAEVTPALLDHAARLAVRGYDEVNGGFGGAPKFPPHMLLLFLLRGYQRTGSAQLLEIVRHTSEAMARGGLFDQVAGGFHRYTVDNNWIVPHFEKMLYDNALLLRVYAELWRVTKDPLAKRVADDTAAFLLGELSTAEGGFASALDADTEGVEGLTYAWNRQQLKEVLGEDDAQWAADLLGVTEEGNFEDGLSVLRMMRDIDDLSPELQQRWAEVRARLMAARAQRPQPGRDDKIVASWNGLAITGLCELARLSDRDDLLAAAVRAGELLKNVHVQGGRIRRVSRDGVVGEPAGVLEDYGCVAEAFCALHQLTNDGAWLEAAKELLDTALSRFGNGAGSFYDTADDAQKLVTRPADPTDNATPSGQSSLVSALLTYSALSGEPSYHEAAQRALATTGDLLAKFPRFAGYIAAAGEALLSGPVEIAIVRQEDGGDTREGSAELLRTAVWAAPGGAVIVHGEPDQTGVPLLAGRTQPGAVYVCRGFVCDRPVTTSVELTTMLRR